MYEKCVTDFLHPSVLWRPRRTPWAKVHQSRHWCTPDNKDQTTNTPNFILLWQPVYEISAAEFRWFRWKRDRQTWLTDVTDNTSKRCEPYWSKTKIIFLSPHTMRRQTYYHLVTAEPTEPSFTVKMIDSVYQTGPIGKKHSILRYVIITPDLNQVCHGQSLFLSS